MDKRIEKVKQCVNDLLASDKSGHGMEHIERVLNLTLKFAKTEGGDPGLSSVIALLHDADDYKLFGEKSARELTNTRRILKSCDFTAREQDIVCETVQTIGYSRRLEGILPTTLEAKVVADADMNDALGATAIVRVIEFGATNSRPFFNRDIFPKQQVTAEGYSQYFKANGQTDAHSVLHFFDKLLRLPKYMLTDSGLQAAIPRQKFLVDFLNQFFAEQNVPEWQAFLTDFLEKNQLQY